MTLPRVITEALGGSPLSRAVAEGRAPTEWIDSPPATTREWHARVDRVRESFATSDWIGALYPALAPSGRAAERLDAVRRGQGVVITTGQQPGLFGGPIYTWSKAISALALADALQDAIGVPVAPIFWAATDDSDFAEASWTMVARTGGVEELRMNGDGTGVSMANMPLGDQLHLLERLQRAAGSAAYREPLDLLRLAYDPAQTVGGAYVALLRGILEPLGVSVLDAAHSAVRRAGAPLLRAALGSAANVAAAVAERDRALTASGYSPQVASVAGLSLVFVSDRGQRERVPIADAGRVVHEGDEATLSPNVLLRPVVERAILPTVAYLAGPAELAYFAQTGAVADALGGARPLALPRWSCTLIEPHVDEIMQRLSLAPDDLLDPHAAETRLARAALPSDVSSALARMRTALDEGLGVLERDTADLVASAVIAGGAGSIAHRVGRLERRLVAAMKRRNATTLQDVATARGSLYPRGKRQERALNFMPFLARYGPPVLERMIASAAAHAHALAGRSAGAATPEPSSMPTTGRV